ncbi:MAG: low-specificity L-threonine aldolase [Acidimicrobiales bacterium]|nr:low-specificity L-threonine aldolase [Acidimicrobiales bacterium]
MIDLRSDTVSQPSEAMREAIASAVVGDDVFGDDPTVNELESYTAKLLDKEAAMFVPSGTQSNLCALLAHCQRGDEYIVGDHAHTYMYEGGGAAVLGSIQPQPIPMLESGMLDLNRVRESVKPDDIHFPRSRLLCIENTTNGKAISLKELAAGAEAASDNSLLYHLDGARLWNAAISLGVEANQIAAFFDSISVCLSKGLGAPVGSVLVGKSSFINEARKWRKMLGGGMRQTGLIAAAGLFAIQNNVNRLAQDHKNAALLATGLEQNDGITIEANQTNMVFIQLRKENESIQADLHDLGIRTIWNKSHCRLVTHIDITENDIDKVTQAFAKLV